MRRLRFSHTTMFRARQTLARSCFSSGQIFSTIFITQSLINSPSVKDLQCLAISVALKRRPSLSAFLFLVTVTILETGWKGSHKGHATKVLPHLCLATFCWNVKYIFFVHVWCYGQPYWRGAYYLFYDRGCGPEEIWTRAAICSQAGLWTCLS